MDDAVYPGIFAAEGVKAFFTGKTTGIEPSKLFSIIGERASLYMPVQRHTNNVIIIKTLPHPPNPLSMNGEGEKEREHGEEVLSPSPFMERGTGGEVGDAVVTNVHGLLIGVQTADCVPIILYDRSVKVAAAIHAGWRGTAREIFRKTTEAMKTQFGSSPEEILAAIGPAIGPCCYEVGQEVISAVTGATGEGDYVTSNGDKWFVDLQKANFCQALAIGITKENIWLSTHCTSCMPNIYHSYRKTKGTNGRQGAFIGMF
ncbi:MAG: peptidoglycan editing factor PgeF [Nitrospirae bacterium]|nr:peptidoglycan editing factor PgeF [Nitrospirota bacterium]